jgi:hydrogenase maturation factor HypF (carbamoyltransferase family)
MLLKLSEAALTKQGFTVYFPQKFPSNDGGLALGQAMNINTYLRLKNR